MANISAHFLILSAICILMLFALERRVSALGIGIWFLGCIAAVATAFPASGVETIERLPPSLGLKVLSALESISYALIPIDPRFMPPHWTGIGAPMSAVVGLFVAAIGCFALARNRRAAAIYLLFFAAMFSLGTFLYPTAARHTAMLFLSLIGLEWMLAEDAGGPALPTHEDLGRHPSRVGVLGGGLVLRRALHADQGDHRVGESAQRRRRAMGSLPGRARC